MRLIITALAAFVIAAPMSAAEPAQALIDRAIEYHGGSLYEKTETSMVITSKSGSFRLISKTAGGLFDHRVERVRNGRNQIVRLTNDTVEIIADGETDYYDGEIAEKLKDFVWERVYFPFLPYRLNDPGVIKTDLGEESWDGKLLRKVKVTFEGGHGDEYIYWFDPKTARLEQFAYSYEIHGGGLRLRKAFNHRSVDGIVFFDSKNLGVSGRHDIEVVTPEWAEAELSLISTVTLGEIEVAKN